MALNEDLRTVADGAGSEGQSGQGRSVCKASHVEARFSSATLPVTLPDLFLCLTRRDWSWALAGGSKGGIAYASIKHGFPVKI